MLFLFGNNSISKIKIYNINVVINSCMLGNFSCFRCRLLTFFFKINIFKKIFLEPFESVKLFGSRSGLMLCWS